MALDLDELIASVNRHLKAEVLQRGTRLREAGPVPRIPTPSYTLNDALGGGIPKGRITEVYGYEHTGKTSLALGIAARVQQEGGTVAYVDVESSAAPGYFERMGVDLDRLILVTPRYGEQAMDIVEALARRNVDLVIVDSLAALEPLSELSRSLQDPTVGRQAALMSAALRKISAAYRQSSTTLVFLNQVREKVGALGDPTTTPGGRAIRFYASVRIELRRVGYIKASVHEQGRSDDVAEADGHAKAAIVGMEVLARVVKNRFGVPFRTAVIPIRFDRGIDTAEELLRLHMGKAIRASGAWFSVVDPATGEPFGPDGEPLRFQGRGALKEAIESTPALRAFLERCVGGPTAQAAPSSSSGEPIKGRPGRPRRRAGR